MSLEQFTHFRRTHQLLDLGHDGQICSGVLRGNLPQQVGQPAIDEEIGLAGIAQQIQTRLRAGTGNGAEIHMSGDVLQARQEEGVGVGMMAVMTHQGMTGDSETTAQAVARKLGLDQVIAGVLPDQKAEKVKALQHEGRRVAMAGDGVNDAPALAQAQVGIAMGTGTDVAMESAGVTLVKGDLNGIVRARQLSRATMRNIRQNLFFAFIYNSLGVPVAAGVLYPFFGLLLSPMIAAAAMSFSSVSVVFNALRLNRVRL